MIIFLKNIYFELVESRYFKNLFLLTTGVGVSQLIPLFLLPILTRFFSPTDFGVLAIFLAIVQLLAITTTLRLEMAIVLPKKDTDAALLCLTAMLFLSVFSILFFIILFLLWSFIVNTEITEYYDTVGYKIFGLNIENLIKYKKDTYIPFFYLIPIGSFCLGLYNILYSWNNRMELYKNMSFSQITHSIFSTPLSILFYFTPLKKIGLILGQVIGRFIACLLLLKNIYITLKIISRKELFSKSIFLVKEYKKFIIFETPHAMLNFISQKYIIGVFTSLFGLFTVSIFDLADKIIAKPLGLISNSFKTVFYKRLTTAKDKLTIFKKTLILMTVISFVLTIPFYIIPDSFFVILLGPEWVDTGRYIKLLCPLLFSRFIFNVVTPSISYTMQNHYLLFWQIFYFLGLVFLFIFSKGLSVENVIFIYAIFGALMYFLLGFISFLVLKKNIKF